MSADTEGPVRMDRVSVIEILGHAMFTSRQVRIENKLIGPIQGNVMEMKIERDEIDSNPTGRVRVSPDDADELDITISLAAVTDIELLGPWQPDLSAA